MASKVSSESKHIAKRVIIGVVTGVVTTASIYFLGFNRSPNKASQIEVKKNTVKAWRTFVDLENAVQPKYDSNLAKSRRSEITALEYRSRDSLVASEYIQRLTDLQQEKDLDQDFTLMLDRHINYIRQQMNNAYTYVGTFARILDTAISFEEKSEMIKDLNKELEDKRTNLIERTGRNIESVSFALARKYKYPFQISDFHFNLFYQTLKKSKVRASELPEEPAPSDPQVNEPSLPD